ncbi:MAG: hypothetical protein Kow001_02170 [Acidobacteriota bacterium]
MDTGDLAGTITDQTGAVLPGARVTVLASETGLERTGFTDEEGRYRVPLLSPGWHEVRVEMPGFADKVVQGLRINVGQHAELNIQMEISATETEVVVTAEPGLIERERTMQSSAILEDQIDALPINGRDYLNFSLLAPGSAAQNPLQTFSAPQTPSSGLSFAGQDPRSNAVSIDGLDNMDVVSGGVRATMSQEAIQEFQISQNSYSAEFGRARGGVINIVSKSGTNSFHGNLFAFLRNNALDATNAFSRLEDPPFRRYEAGGTLGGPIVPNRTFFFGSFERLDRKESNFVTFLDDPSIFAPTSGQLELFRFLQAVPVPSLQGLANAFINPTSGLLWTLPANFPGTLQLFESESGVFPFEADNNTSSLKLDHQFSQANDFSARISYSDGFDQGVQFGALQGISNGLSFDTEDLTVAVSDTHIFSPVTVNNLKLQFARRDFNADTNDPHGPEIVISGVAEFGREFFNPTVYRQDITQVSDGITLIRGRHQFKLGVDWNRTSLKGAAEVFLGGQFTFGEAIPLGAVIDRIAGTGTTASLAAALSTPPAAGGLGRPDLAPQLLAPLTPVQSFNFGLPITYFQGFGDPSADVRYTQLALYFQDTWTVRPGFSLNLGVRYDTDWRPETLNVSSTTAPFEFVSEALRDRNNWSPRLGFAWDPIGSGRTVIRGGYGVFYQNFFQAVAFVSQVLSGQISQVFLPITGLPGVGVTSAHVWGYYRQQGSIGVEALQALGLNPGTTPSVILPGANNTVNPYSHHASLGIERQLGKDWALSANYLLNRGVKLIRSRDVNVREIGPNQFALPGLDPRFIQVNMIETSGSSIHHGMTVSLRKRMSRGYTLMGSYTLGKTLDDTTDFITQLQPNNQRDLHSERALSTFDQRHRLVVSGILQSPYRGGGASGWLQVMLADWSVSPIVTWAAGRPFNLLLGYDANGDTHEETDRPVLADGAIAGRNTGRGPDFASADLRLSRRFWLGSEERHVEFVFEAFNLFNRVNYSGVNNVMGSRLLESSSAEGSAGIPANQPLGFTAAFAPRQLQLGLRFTF